MSPIRSSITTTIIIFLILCLLGIGLVHATRSGTTVNDDTHLERLEAHFERVSRSAQQDKINDLSGALLSSTYEGGDLYSGFLAVGGENEGGALHYFLAEASGVAPQDAPLVLWLNGGPGASSFGGSILEHGPLIMNRTGDGMLENPWAWNTAANMVFFESPPVRSVP